MDNYKQLYEKYYNAFSQVKASADASRPSSQISNVSGENNAGWYSGDQPTWREAVGRAYEISRTDPVMGNELRSGLQALRNDPSSMFYNAYSQPTNRAASNLAANGFNTDLLTNGWLNSSEAAGYIRSNLVYDGATNTPKAPGKKSTADQYNAYWLNQYLTAEKDTNAAQSEIDGSFDFIKYWTGSDQNLSDEQIKQKYKDEYYQKNCKTLQKMQSNADANKPLELNRAMEFSDDTIDAMIWMARNPEYNGSIEGAMAYSYLGEGNTYKEDPEISAMLDPKNPAFLPYNVGSTNLDDAAFYFGVRTFTPEWIAEHNGLQFEDSEAGNMYKKVLAAEENTTAAEMALSGLNAWKEKNKDEWETPEEAQKALDKVLSKRYVSVNGQQYDLSILNKIDVTLGKGDQYGTGDLIAFNRPVNYKYDNMVGELGEIATANASRKTDTETTNEMADDLSIASTEPAAMPEPQKPAATDEIDAVSGVDQIVKKPESKPEMKPSVPAGNESTIPKYTDAEIEQIKTQDKKIREAADTVENVATANESTVMKNAGSVAFFGNKDRFSLIRNNAVSNQRFADGLTNISAKNMMSEGLGKAHSVAEYSNVEANYAADQQLFNQYRQKYGDLQYLQKEFKPTMTLTLEGADGDTYNVTLTYQDMNKGYQISDVVNTNYVFGESESGNDPGIYEQANAIAKEQTAEAKKILYAQKNVHDNYGEAGEKEVEEYKALSARIHNEESYLADNKEANDQNKAALKKSIEKMEMQYDAMTKEGLDTSGIKRSYDLLNNVLNYHDEPQLPRSTMTKLQYVDMLGELTGGEYDTAQKSELLHSSIESIDAKIQQIQDDIAYAKAHGIEIPDRYLRNMQLTIEDLEADRKGFEYSAILTDTDPEELDKAIEAGKEFEQYVIDNVLIDDNIIHPAYGFEHLQQVSTEEDQKIYYYLLGRQALEHGDEYQALLHSNNPDDVLTKSGELMESIMKDSSDYMDFMYNDDYGVWTSRRAEANKEEAKAMVDSGFGGGLIANVASTLLTPIESLSSAIYILDRAIEGKRINPDSKFRNVTQFKESTRAETRASIEEAYKDNPALKYLANLGYEIYCNRGDSMMNSLLTGAVINGTGMLAEFAGASPMGATAALTAAANAIENGASTEQAWLIAGMTFIAETATEAITYSNIREAFGVKDALTKESLKQFTIDWLTKSGVEEMIGETTNDVVENWADRMAAEWFDNPNYQSEHQKLVDAYYAQGYTGEGEAEAKALEEEMKGYLHTAFVSYISAGTDVMTKAGKAAYNTARSAADVVNGYRSYTKARQQMGFGESMLDYMKQDARDAIASRNQAQEASAQEAGPAVSSEEEEATPEQKQAAADVTALGRVEGSTVTAQTEMIASILDNGDGNEAVTEQASAAAAFLGDMLGDDTTYIVQQVMTGVSRANISRDVITTALQNAALGNGAATAIAQSEQFQNASPEQKAQMLAETVEQDQSNPDVQQNIAAKVTDFRSGMVINDLAANGHFDQAQQAQDEADKAAAETAKAESQLQEKQDALDEATRDVEQKAQAVAENPTDDNMKQHADAVTRADNADESRKQYEEHLAKQQEAQKEADAKAQQAKDDAMTSARETASQTVAQQDQQREADALAKAEAERKHAAEQAEAERQQKIADNRSGKTAEESARAKIQRLAESKGYTGEQAEQFVNDVMNFWQTGQVNKVDLSKQFSKSEGYLMMGALSRRFGINVEITDIPSGENGFYNPNTNTITLNSNLPAGQVLVEFALHELTHSLESTGSYQQYHDTVLNTLYPSEAELNDAIAKKMTDYEEKGHPIDEAQAKRELVAEFTRLKLNDKSMVQRMVDAGMGGRIRNALHNVNQFLKNIKLTGEARTKAENLRRTERMFQKAIQERARAQQKANETATVESNGAETNQHGNNAKQRKPFVRASENISGETKLIKLPDGSIKSFNNTANDIARDVNKTYKTNISNSNISSEIQKARNLFIHGDAEGAVSAVFELAKNIESAIGLSRNSLKPGTLAQSLNDYFGNKYIPISESDSKALVSIYGSIAKANRVLADAGVKARLRLDKNNNSTGLRLDDVFRNNDHVTAEGQGFDVSQALGGVDTARWEDILYELEHQRETYVNQVRDEYTNGGAVSAEDLQAEIHAMLWNQVVNYSDVSVDENNRIQIQGNEASLSPETETDWGIDEDDLAFSAAESELTDAQKAQALHEANVDYEEAVARGDMEAAQEDVDFYAEQNGFDTQEKAYHGTDSFGFTEFDMEQSQDMIFVAYSKDMAGTYVSYEDPSVKKVSEAVKLNKPVKEMNGQELFEAAKKYLKTIEGSEVLSIDYDPKSDMYTVTTDESNYFDPNATVTQEFIEYDIKHYLQNSIDELSAGIYQFYTRPGKQLVIDADSTSWDDISVPFNDETMSTREIAEWARNNGYDSVRINGIWDYGGNGPDLDGYGDIGIFFNQNDVKSADPVTYDDNGNVIPLDQRFTDSTDIRYSVENNQMTDAERNQALIDAGLMTQEELMAQENLPGYPAEGGEAQRQFGYETAQESNALHDEVKQYLYTHSNYMPDTNQGQVNRAIGWVQSKATESDPDGYYAALDEIASDTFDYRSADGQARMLTVMSMAALKAENGKTAEERRNALNDELRIADAYNKQGTDLGRALQARKIFRLMTPLGRVAALQSMADRINEDYGKKGIKNRVGLSEWTLKAASEAQTEEDFQKVQDAAAKELAEQMPVSWKERLNALRMLSMLGNPRTHIRNIIGNALFVPAVSLKNKLGAVMELGMDKGDRTKTLALAVSKEIRDFARQDAETMKDTLTGTAKYNENSKVQMERKIFGTGDGILSKTVGNFIQTLSDFNSNALEGEDWFFLKGHYRRALGGWIQANGYTVDEVQSNPDLLEKGRQYAIEEAQKATYRDFNEMAKRLNDATRDAKTVWGKSLTFGVNAVLPFKKTPANILRRGLEYSPLGIAKSLTTDAFHLHQYNEYQKGNLEVLPESAISPNQFIDKLCSGLTGSAIMAVGFLLAGSGAVTCGLDDDDDEFEKLKGGQEYSVNLGKLGNMVTEGLFKAKLFGEDVTFTMDWAAPMSMPFFVGAALREQVDGEGVTDIDGVLNAIFSIGEPLTNLSMLDGLNSVFRTSQNSDAITQVGAKIVSNYMTSFIPSAVGAVARSFDPIRRKSFVESGKGSGPAGIFRSSIEQSKNKIPGMSMNSIPVRDAFGNVEETGAIERILENFVLPGYLNSYKNDPVIDELERLYGMVDESKKSGMVPKMPQKTIGNGKVVLSAEQYDQLTEERGKTAHALIEQLMSNRYYQQVSDDDKATMINDVWTYATQNANYSISKDAKVDTWVLNSRANPIQGIVNRQKARVDTEYKEGYKAAAVESVKNQNWDDLDVCIEKLEEAGVKDPEGSIKTAVGNAFKAQYIRAYQEGDSITMDEIETLLIDSGLGFDSVNKKGQSTFDIWIENMNDQVLSEEEPETGNTGSIRQPARFIASAGMSDSAFSNRTASMPERPASDNDWDQYMNDLDDYWADYDFASNDPVGQYGQGNIDLDNRQTVQNDDGSISTEQSFSFYDEQTGKEVLIPLIADGRVMTQDEAIDRYYETGEYLGMFDDWHDADEYATMLHNRQDWYYHQ